MPIVPKSARPQVAAAALITVRFIEEIDFGYAAVDATAALITAAS